MLTWLAIVVSAALVGLIGMVLKGKENDWK